jgi:HD-GYP domain-containing protein (c-di-GMP phosphodiesterase class II)
VITVELNIPIIDIVLSLSSAIDLIDPTITNHHKRVAYISYSIAKEMNLPDKEIKDLILACLLHDCGAVNMSERNPLFEFEYKSSMLNKHSHAYKGWFILREASELKDAAEIIKYHHVFWDEQSNSYLQTYKIPMSSYILHLADRIDVLINRNQEILKQRRYIENMVKSGSGTMFMPKVVEAFNNLLPKPYFWFDIVSQYLDVIIKKVMSPYKVYINSSSFHEYANITHRIIDFRSRFTATHSIGVASSSSTLSAKLGFSVSDTELMHSAGLMHDLGKLCIPEYILEKPGPLDKNEYNLIKSHTYHTYRILNSIPGLDKVRDWAAFHHEKLDGTGYPFELSDDGLDLGSRILAVSDMFTALTEERPYRHAMPLENAMEIINNTKNLDYDVKACLNQNLEEINELRKTSQENVTNSCHELFHKEE